MTFADEFCEYGEVERFGMKGKAAAFGTGQSEELGNKCRHPFCL